MGNKPSSVEHGGLYTVRIYRDDGGDVQVYDRVKHAWWGANNTVLIILQYMGVDRKEWRYIHWLREHITWWQITPYIEHG